VSLRLILATPFITSFAALVLSRSTAARCSASLANDGSDKGPRKAGASSIILSLLHNGSVTIMTDNVAIIRARQLGIRRQIDKRGIALKLVAADSGIPYETLLTYFPQEGSREPAQIPGGAIYALCEGKALPADLLSLMLPDGWQIVRLPEGIDHDRIAEMATII
jgi:hypothetical protein